MPAPTTIYGETLDALYDALQFARLRGWLSPTEREAIRQEFTRLHGRPRDEWQAVFRGPKDEYETLKRVALALGFEAVEGRRARP